MTLIRNRLFIGGDGFWVARILVHCELVLQCAGSSRALSAAALSLIRCCCCGAFFFIIIIFGCRLYWVCVFMFTCVHLSVCEWNNDLNKPEHWRLPYQIISHRYGERSKQDRVWAEWHKSTHGVLVQEAMRNKVERQLSTQPSQANREHKRLPTIS